MPLFTSDELKNVSKAKIQWLKLSCGRRECVKTDKYGSPILDADGRVLTETKIDVPRTYELRFLPFLDRDGETLLYKSTATYHKLNSGTTAVCTCSQKGGCEYCAKAYPKTHDHYALVFLQGTDAGYSTGMIYGLKFNGWLEQELLKFIKETVDEGIDATSLLDDGCYVNIEVSLNDSGYPRYKISMGDKGRCPFDNKIRNHADIVNFCRKPEVPDLQGYIDNITQRQLQKTTYAFEDVENKFAKYEREHVEIIRGFNPDALDIEDAFSATTSVSTENNKLEIKPSEEIRFDEEGRPIISEEQSIADLKELLGF